MSMTVQNNFDLVPPPASTCPWGREDPTNERQHIMAMPGETIHRGAPSTCPDCDVKLENRVMSSAAGYYIGTRCDCGPSYSRESGYYEEWDEVNAHFEADTWARR